MLLVGSGLLARSKGQGWGRELAGWPGQSWVHFIGSGQREADDRGMEASTGECASKVMVLGEEMAPGGEPDMRSNVMEGEVKEVGFALMM
jgi:hypothetical protein